MITQLILCLILCIQIGEVMSQTGLSSTEKQEILDLHNNLRGMVNPSASNMEKMLWSDELAQVAQTYAEQCNFEHNANRVSQQSTFATVGENLAPGSGTADYAGFVQGWYDERQNFDFAAGTCSGTCGHYIQVAWATSRSLGCGAFRCSTLANAGGTGQNFVILVCNYGPAGNLIGKLPYRPGRPCSSCPSDLQICTSNLCSGDEPTTTGIDSPSTTAIGSATGIDSPIATVIGSATGIDSPIAIGSTTGIDSPSTTAIGSPSTTDGVNGGTIVTLDIFVCILSIFSIVF